MRFVFFRLSPPSLNKRSMWNYYYGFGFIWDLQAIGIRSKNNHEPSCLLKHKPEDLCTLRSGKNPVVSPLSHGNKGLRLTRCSNRNGLQSTSCPTSHVYVYVYRNSGRSHHAWCPEAEQCL